MENEEGDDGGGDGGVGHLCGVGGAEKRGGWCNTGTVLNDVANYKVEDDDESVIENDEDIADREDSRGEILRLFFGKDGRGSGGGRVPVCPGAAKLEKMVRQSRLHAMVLSTQEAGERERKLPTERAEATRTMDDFHLGKETETLPPLPSGSGSDARPRGRRSNSDKEDGSGGRLQQRSKSLPRRWTSEMRSFSMSESTPSDVEMSS